MQLFNKTMEHTNQGPWKCFKFKAVKAVDNEGGAWKELENDLLFLENFYWLKSYWTFRHVTVNFGNNVTLEGLFVKKYSEWNILLLY